MDFLIDRPNENNPDDLILTPIVMHHGKYPLYGVSGHMVNIDQTKSDRQMILIPFNIGDLTPRFMTKTSIRLAHHGKDLNYNIFYVARNGAWVQILRRRWVGNGWGTATKFLKGLGGEEIYREVSPNFPHGLNGEIDWGE
jgi:hypothetical protein